MPVAIIQPILLKLTDSHILVEFNIPQEEDDVYQPAVDPNMLSIAFVINALEQSGQNQLPELNQEPVFSVAVSEFRTVMEASCKNCLLRDI